MLLRLYIYRRLLNRSRGAPLKARDYRDYNQNNAYSSAPTGFLLRHLITEIVDILVAIALSQKHDWQTVYKRNRFRIGYYGRQGQGLKMSLLDYLVLSTASTLVTKIDFHFLHNQKIIIQMMKQVIYGELQINMMVYPLVL